MRKLLAVLLALSMLSVSIPVLAEENAAEAEVEATEAEAEVTEAEAEATEAEAETTEAEAEATEAEAEAAEAAEADAETAEADAETAEADAETAEADAANASGTWYLIALGLTAGTLELNEDGTFTLEVLASDEAKKIEGTWTQEEDKVSLTVNNETAPLVFDGTELKFNAEDIESLGLNIAEFDVDLSLVSRIIRISREPGKVTQAEMNAYQEDGTLPEGKTQEDMEAAEDELISGFLLLIVGMADTEEAE